MLKNNKVLKILTIIIVLIIVLISINALTGNKIINGIYSAITGKAIGESAESKITYIVYDNQNENDIKTLVTIKNEDGIEYIKKPDGVQINGYGKRKISIDIDNIAIDEERTFKIKSTRGSETEKVLKITKEGISKQVQIIVDDTELGLENTIVNAQVFYAMQRDTDRIKYKLNETDTEQDYTGNIKIDLSQGSIATIYLTKEDEKGNKLYIEKESNIQGLKFLTLSEATWENGRAKITMTKESDIQEGEKVEYAIYGTNSVEWKELEENSKEIDNLEYGTVVVANLIDVNGEDKAIVSKRVTDTIAPRRVEVELVPTSIMIGETAQGSIIVEDDESGVNFSKAKSNESKYLFHKQRIIENENESMYTGKLSGTITDENITHILNATGTYYLHVMVKDIAGNITYSVSNNTIEVHGIPATTVEEYISINAQKANEYIGRIVKNYTAGNVEWKIFDIINGKIILITSNAVATGATGSGNGSLEAYLAGNDARFNYTMPSFNGFRDIYNLNSYLDSSSNKFGESVRGGVTIQEFCSSFNKTHDNLDEKIYCDSSNSYGYGLRHRTGGVNKDCSIATTTGGNGVYYIGGDAWWTVSPAMWLYDAVLPIYGTRTGGQGKQERHKIRPSVITTSGLHLVRVDDEDITKGYYLEK